MDEATDTSRSIEDAVGAATLVVCSDVHLDRRFAWCRPEAARTRRHNLRRCFVKAAERAVSVNADALLIAGDLFEDALYTPDTAAFIAEVLALDFPVLVTPGNHDYHNAGSLYARQSWPANVVIFDEQRFVAHELTPGLTIWGAAHRQPRGTPGFFEDFEGVDRAGVNLALFHGSERAGFAHEEHDKSMHAPFDAAQIRTAGFDFGFVGHYHRHRVDGDHCYPGNPDPLDFGEDAAGGLVVATIGAHGGVAVRSESIAVTSCEVVSVDVDGASSMSAIAGRLLDCARGLSGFVRFDLAGTVERDVVTDIEEIHAAVADRLATDLEDWLIDTRSIRPAYPVATIADEPTVRGAFVRDVLAHPDYDDHTRRQLLEIGLRAFDGRRDLQVV